MSVADWFGSLTKDPNDGSVSSARVAALLCALSACGIAIGGLVLNRDQSGTVAALLGGSVGSFFARTKAPPAKDV